MAKQKTPLTVESIKHDDATRKNIPTAEYQSVMRKDELNPIRIAYERRNRDLDPQLVWRGKDEQDGSDLVVHAPPLYIQEKVHPKVLIDDLLKQTEAKEKKGQMEQLDLFSDFNGLPDEGAKTEFYQHDANWTNRMILGDSLQVMASLAEREGLRGKVQCIYFDPPYGIKFNSNFQWSTTSRDVKDGNTDHITREPEQVKAFRDTWRDGIHSYLTYLRDRLTVARDLLTDSGSIFVQIGDENVHRVRAVMDEVFGEGNLVSVVAFKKTSGTGSNYLENIYDHIIWFSKDLTRLKYRQPLAEKSGSLLDTQYTGRDEFRIFAKYKDPRFMPGDMSSQGASESGTYPFTYQGQSFRLPANTHWKASREGMPRLAKSIRLIGIGQRLRYRRYADDFPVVTFSNSWDDTIVSGYADPKVYVVQTSAKVIQRCILMSTDPGDLVLDPTCGSGTSAYVAEQWGRRWITIDTSRVALALARARIMGARYPYYLLSDSREGQAKEGEITRKAPSTQPVYGNIRQGFVYERVPHITLKSIANNAEIDVIWEKYQQVMEPLREKLNSVLSGQCSVVSEGILPIKKDGTPQLTTNHRSQATESVDSCQWSVDSEGILSINNDGTPQLTTDHKSQATALEEWEIPRERPEHWPQTTQPLLTDFWKHRIARQKEIDASIAAKADHEFLYDKPYEDKKKVRVAGPFTVESLSPHRVLAVGPDDELLDTVADPQAGYGGEDGFVRIILENLKTSGVQQAHKADKINFSSLNPWPGHYICAEGRYDEVVSGQCSVISEGILPNRVASGQWSVVSEGILPIKNDGTPQLTTNHGPQATEQTTNHRPQATTKRAGIFIGPEFGTVSRTDLVESAKEAGDAGFDVLIACAFNYDAHSSEFTKLGRIPILKARMNADLHMADDLKNTGKGNLFVIFGEPDISVVSGQWLVDSKGRMVANYEYVKELSGFGSLEEINRAGRDGLSRIGTLPSGRKIRNDQSGQTGGSLDTRQHRGRGSEERDGGISSVPGNSQRISGGDGNVSDSVSKTGHGHPGEHQTASGNGERRWSASQRTQTLAALKNLTKEDFPLALTTEHKTQITVHGVDVFHPNTGEVRSDGADGIACWFIDTDYNGESFFVRHAYFLGANDPYKSLKTTLKAEINQDAWNSLNSDMSRPFDKPASGRIAVKVINHLGDEVMKVYRVDQP